MILFINACVRADSRTRRLAEAYLLKQKRPYREVHLEEIDFPKVSEDFLERRDRLIAERAFSDPMFALAREFAEAEEIVIAAPYWDMSFPAVLKQYIEQITVLGITFLYTPEGIPQGLCRADQLTYIATAGGNAVQQEFGFGYLKALAEQLYGIPKVRLTQAAGLDIKGADPEKLLAEYIEKEL